MKKQMIKQILEMNKILESNIRNKISAIRNLTLLLEKNFFLEDSLLEFLFFENETIDSLNLFIKKEIKDSKEKEEALEYFEKLKILIEQEKNNYEEEEEKKEEEDP